MKRYTILHTTEGGGPGGAETVLLELATNLDSNRFRSLALLTGDDWLRRQLIRRKVQTTLVETKAWYDFRLPRALTRLIRQEKVDLIHSHLPDQNFYSCLAARLTGTKAVVTYHGTPGLLKKAGIKAAVKAKTVRQGAVAIVVVSDFLRRTLTEFGFPAEKIVRIYNGVDFDRFSSATPGRLREELGLPANAKLVGMVANLRQSKGYEHFIQAARLVADAHPEACFVVVGEKDECIRPRLESQIAQLRLDGRVTLLGFRDDVPQVLSDLDVFVLSSVTEGLSIATLEAMAAGRPVVVTRSGGPQEIVDDGKTGFLVPPADPETLAARVCEILLHPELGARLGEAARKEVQDRFTISRMVSEYEALYERCLGGR